MNHDQLRILALTSVAHFMNDGLSAIFPLMFPLLATLITSNLLIAVIATVFYIFSSFASPYATSRAEKSGNMGRGMGTGILILAAGTIGMGIVVAPLRVLPYVSYGLILIFAAVAGFGSSFFHPIGASLIQSTFGEEVQGFALGTNGIAGSSGRALFSTISAAVFLYLELSHNTYLAIVYGMVVLGFAGIVVALLVLAYFTRGKGTPARGKYTGPRSRIGILPVVRKTWLLVLITVVRNISGTGVFIFLPTFLISEKFSSYSLGLGFTMTIVLAGSIAGQPLFGKMSDIIGRRASLFITTIGSGLFMILFLASTSLYPYSVVFLVLFGTFAYSGFPILLPIAYSQLTPETRATGNSVIWAAIGSGSAAGPIITQLLAQRGLAGSLYGSFLLLSVITVAVAFLSFAVSVKGDRRQTGKVIS